MKTLSFLYGTTGMALAVVAGLAATPAMTQDAPLLVTQATTPPNEAPATISRAEAKRKARAEKAAARRRARADRLAHQQGKTAGPEGNDIVVNGYAGSLKTARNIKKNAKQIVDAVVAEDVGKLPDNNVPEALARLPGIGIDRVHGEGQNVTIRGLGDIQTTINGQEVGSDSGRAANLADIPAELLKSVSVYKTRTADQVEGGIAGTVDVELRRPLDLKKGWTIAGGLKDAFRDIGNTWSPQGSLLAAYRRDTAIGEMGLLVNFALTKNRYEEDYNFSESPDNPCAYYNLPGDLYNPNDPLAHNPTGDTAYVSNNCRSLIAAGYGPPNQADYGIFVPYRVTYAVEHGQSTRPSLNVAYQWRPSDKLDFVLEGSWFGTRGTDYSDRLSSILRDDQSTYTDVVLADHGFAKSLTDNSPGILGAGPESSINKNKSNNFNTNFEAHWHSGIAQINAGVQYNWANSHYRSFNAVERFPDEHQVQLDFDSPNVPGGGPYITFPDVDLSDPSAYYLNTIHDEFGSSKNNLLTGNVDVTLHTADTGLIRSLQFGARATNRNNSNQYGYRDTVFDQTSGMPLSSSLPGTSLVQIRPDIPGVTSPSWYNLNTSELSKNWDEVRAYLKTQPVSTSNGGTLDTTLPDPQNGSEFRYHEQTVAAYAQLNYAFKAVFPIDGVLGVRIVDTFGTSMSTSSHVSIVNGVATVTSPGPVNGRGNYVDVLPSLNAVVHFLPKLQMRMAYTYNSQRPSFAQLTPGLSFDSSDAGLANQQSIVSSGNPELKPVTEKSYDATLEYTFGRAGSISAGAFLKLQKGFIYNTNSSSPVYIPLLSSYHILQEPRNAGPGRIQGFEFAGQSFFDFLPGLWKNFGVSANFTYIPTASLILDDYTRGTFTPEEVPGLYYAPFTSKYTYNIQGYFDTPKFGARIAWNYRSHYKDDINAYSPLFQVYTRPTSRLDASVNWTPYKFLTFTVEGANLLKNSSNAYYGAFGSIPVGVRVQAREISGGIRFRF